MKRHIVSFLAIAALLPLAALSTGCTDGLSVDSVRAEIERRIPEARFEPEEHFRLGRISMGFVHGILNLVPDVGEARQIVNEVHRVEVATYKVKSLPDLARLETTDFERELARTGWSLTVRTREAGEQNWVFLRTHEDGVVSNLFVVSLEKDELTLVRLEGRLDRAFAAAVANHPLKVAQGIGGKD